MYDSLEISSITRLVTILLHRRLNIDHIYLGTRK